MIRTLKQFRDECINNYESDLSIAPWKERYKEGYRCVPVEITEIKEIKK